MKKILIPLNQSELSHKILPSVEKLFAADDHQLLLYFVTHPPSAAGFGEPDFGAGYMLPGDQPVTPTLHPIYASQQQDSIRAHVEAELNPMTERLRQAGYQVDIEVGFDKDPVESILRVVDSGNIDLVAMSSLGRVGVTRFFFRNIAETLAQKAKIPVLLVHP